MALADISLWTVFAAAVAGFATGAIWYSNPLVANRWVPLAYPEGMPESADGPQWAPYAIGAAGALISAAVLGYFLTLTPTAGLASVLAVAALAWAGFTGAAFAPTYAFGDKPWQLFAIDAGHYLASFLVMGLVFGLWPW